MIIASKRSKPENMVLCSLWGSYSKPVFDVFLKPFALRMYRLAHEGNTTYMQTLNR